MTERPSRTPRIAGRRRAATMLLRAALVTLAFASVGGAMRGALAAIQPPVLDIDAVPGLDSAGRTQYAHFLLINLPRAFALSANGKSGWFGGTGTIEAARAKALQSCAEKGGAGCAIYAEDLRVVWPGRPPEELAAVPGPLIQTIEYAFVPDQRFIWHGPQTAAGLYIWGHGQNNMMDSRGQQPQQYVRAFNNAGFDVVRFDREPSRDYRDDAAAWLRQGLATLRQRGWRKIVAGGQSRGGWTSLQILDVAGLADAVIATSPAFFGGPSGSDNTGDLYRLIQSAHAPTTRVAIAQFTGDRYVTNMDRRVGMYRDDLQPRVAALLLIDRPADITGHGGGSTATFSLHFADCLLHFVMDPTPQNTCAVPRE